MVGELRLPKRANRELNLKEEAQLTEKKKLNHPKEEVLFLNHKEDKAERTVLPDEVKDKELPENHHLQIQAVFQELRSGNQVRSHLHLPRVMVEITGEVLITKVKIAKDRL